MLKGHQSFILLLLVSLLLLKVNGQVGNPVDTSYSDHSDYYDFPKESTGFSAETVNVGYGTYQTGSDITVRVYVGTDVYVNWNNNHALIQTSTPCSNLTLDGGYQLGPVHCQLGGDPACTANFTALNTPQTLYFFDITVGPYDHTTKMGICLTLIVIDFTPSPSLTPTQTPSTSPSSTPSPTSSVSATLTPTSSVSTTPSPTSSISTSVSPTSSVSLSISSSLSVSLTPSASTSPTPSVTLTPTTSPSTSATPTPSISVSQSPIPCRHPGATVERAEEWLTAINCDHNPTHDMNYNLHPFTSEYTVGVGLTGCHPDESIEGDCSGEILFFHTCRGKTDPNPCHLQKDYLAATVTFSCADYEQAPYPIAVCRTNQKLSDNVISHSPFVCSSAPPQPSRPAPSPHPLHF